MADARLYESKKIAEAAQLLEANDTARVLAELSGLAEVLKSTTTNTIFVGGGGGRGESGITKSLLSNPQFLPAPVD